MRYQMRMSPSAGGTADLIGATLEVARVEIFVSANDNGQHEAKRRASVAGLLQWFSVLAQRDD